MNTSALNVSYHTPEVSALNAALKVWSVAPYYLKMCGSLPSLNKDHLFICVPRIIENFYELIDPVSPLESCNSTSITSKMKTGVLELVG
jgi:hypothetical protein